MPLLPQWGQVDPWGKEVESQRQAYAQNRQTLQGAFQMLQQNLSIASERRQNLQDQEQAFRDREYRLVNTATDKLIQPQTNSKVTDVQLQEVGHQIKQEYYDAIKTYQNSEKSDEDRQAFEAARSKSLSSARTINGALEALTGQTEAFRAQYNNGGISAAVDPSVRNFMADLIDPETPSDKYQIITDPETNELKYIDTETGGEQVNFFLSDVANGDNQFRALPKVDMPKAIQGFLQGVSFDKKQIENETGIAEVTDWAAIGNQIDGRLDDFLKNEDTFKTVAAEEGFGWDAFDIVSRYDETGEPYVDIDGTEYTSVDEIKAAVKQDIVNKIEAITPHQQTQVYTKPEFRKPDLSQQAATQEGIEKQSQLDDQIGKAAQQGDIDFFRNQLLGKIKGVDDMVIKDGKLVLVSGFGKKATPEQVYDLSKTGDLQRLSELFGGSRDLSQQADRASGFKSQLNQ